MQVKREALQSFFADVEADNQFPWAFIFQGNSCVF